MLDPRYIAGFFDGEGCVLISRYAGRNGTMRYELHVTIYQNDPDALLLIQDQFGGSIKPDRRTKGAYAGYIGHRWTIYGSNAVAFLQAIAPFSIGKKPQIELGIRFQEHLRNNFLQGSRYGPSKLVSPEQRQRIMSERDGMYWELRGLKKAANAPGAPVTVSRNHPRNCVGARPDTVLTTNN